jgi:hypothetical protein
MCSGKQKALPCAHPPRFVGLVVGNTLTSRDRLDKTIREIEDQEAIDQRYQSCVDASTKNGQLLFEDRASKMAALAASGRRIIDDMNKLCRAT